MLTFTNSWLLLLLLLVPLAIRRWMRRPQPALRHSQVGLLATLPGGQARWIARAGVAARAAALTLLVVGLAGPRVPDLATRIPTEGISIAMLLDVSGSMATPDFEWDGEPIPRIDAVKRAFRLFVAGGAGPDGQQLPGRAGDLISLVPFATRPETACPLTLSHGVLLQELDKQEPLIIPGESETNISDAIIEGLERLRKAGTRRRVIVLLSDGEDNVKPSRSGYTPRQAAQIAGNLGVPIYAIDAGGEQSGTPAQPAGAEKEHREVGLRTLREVARITGGECFPAHDAASLLAVCGKIDQLERARIESFQYRLHREWFPWLGLGALGLLLGVIGLESTRWQRVP